MSHLEEKKQGRCEAREKAHTAENTGHRGDKTLEILCNYCEGITCEGQTFGESGIFPVSELSKIQLLNFI